MQTSASNRILVSAAVFCALGCSKSQISTGVMSRPSGAANAGPIQFRKVVIETVFRSEGVTAFDVSGTGSGQLDIVTRQYRYPFPPDISTRHEISTPRTWTTGEYSNSYANWNADIDGDGLIDLIVLPRQQQDNPALDPIYWFKNPGPDVDQHWDSFMIAPSTLGERPFYEDLFGDGNRELVFVACQDRLAQCPNTNTLVWAVPGADPTQPWVTTAISDPGSRDVGLDHHGMGVGDINGDGRKDIIVATGWFEGPEDPLASPWIFHRESWLPQFCTSNPPMDPESCCADMYAYDVNADGLTDILCTRPHNRGRWWIEQLAGGGWLEHAMDPEPFTATTPYSESHAARFEDLDGDGVPELITGKRKFAHGTGGEGYAEPGVLVYYKLRVDQTGVNWDRFDIDLEQSSGVGTQFDVRDVNRDGLLDVIISNKTGLYYFEQIPR